MRGKKRGRSYPVLVYRGVKVVPFSGCLGGRFRDGWRMDSLDPKAGGKTVRVNPRFPEATARRLKEASAIRGQSVAAFILETVTREAERVLAEERYWNLSVQAAEIIQKMLAKPPAINAEAKEAAKDLAVHVRIRS